MHKLDTLITEWRKRLPKHLNSNRETVQELENHLRDKTEELIKAGLSVEDAFNRAITELGPVEELASEFQKLGDPVWLPVKLALALAVIVSLFSALIAFYILARAGSTQVKVVLAAHVFTITLGYIAVFLSGGLGICYVIQRCFAEVPPATRRSLSRANRRFAWAATLFSISGVVLGALWARLEWGRYWAWDAKETGGFCVIVWSTLFLILHYFRQLSVRTLALTSLSGNIIVTVAWFGANVLSTLQSSAQTYPPWNLLLMLAAIALHLIILLIGLAPAGWLRIGSQPPASTGTIS
jgi:ABC-type transport system involved in cytochrome c biogenesis permease subunit